MKPDPRCATCLPSGNPRSDWLCRRCRELPENDGWSSSSRLERGGFDPDTFQAGDQKFPDIKSKLWRGRSKFDTDAAREVTKHISQGLKLADAAQKAGVGLDWAKKISAYWKKHLPVKLKGIAKKLRRID